MKKYIKIFIVLLFIILSTNFAKADITVVQDVGKTKITKTGIDFFVSLHSNELVTYTLKSDLGYEPIGFQPFTPFASTTAISVKHGDSVEKFSYLNLEEGREYRLVIRSGTGSRVYLTYTFKTLGDSGAAITITENSSLTEIKSDSIKLGVTVTNGNLVHGLVTLQAQIGYKPIGSAPFAILQTVDKDISGLTSTPTFEFNLLNQGTDYTIKILNKTINKLTAFGKDYKTLGIKKITPKAYVNGKLTVGDTTAIIKYSVVTEGETKNIALKYSTTNSDLLVTVYPTVGGYQEQSVMGTDLNPANVTFNLVGLTPDKLHDFWVIDTSVAQGTPNEISIKNSFHTLTAGAQPYDVYAGIAEGACPDGEYCYLAPLGDKTSIDTSNKSIADYLSYIFKFGIGLAGVLAVIMLIIAGIQYMGSDSFFSKEEAKSSITNALIGLLIALASYLILNTLNPDLVNLKLNIGKEEIAIEFEGDTDTGIGSFSPPQGLYCPKPSSPDPSKIPYIVNSMAGKVTYRFGGKGGPPPYNADTKMCDGVACKSFCPPNTTCLDCSGFVNVVLQCAGMSTYNGGTASIFNGATKVTSLTDTQVNGTNLKIGDLLGWNGHVMIYVGGGNVFDSHGGSAGRKPGQAIGVWPVTKYIDKIKFYKTQ